MVHNHPASVVQPRWRPNCLYGDSPNSLPIKKSATTWENVPSNMSAQQWLKSACTSTHSKSSMSIWRNCAPWRCWSDCVNAQADLKTYLYNFDPLKPPFYIVKLGLQGYTLFILFLLKNIDCGYSLELPRWGGSNEYPQSMFWIEIWKISDIFFSENFQFLVVKFSIYLNRHVLVMLCWGHISQDMFLWSCSPNGILWHILQTRI